MMREEDDMPLQGISRRVESGFCIHGGRFHRRAEGLDEHMRRQLKQVLKLGPASNLRKWEKPQAG